MRPDRSATVVSPDRTGRIITYRPIAIGDHARLQHFHTQLSPETVRQRFGNAYPLEARIEPRRITGQCAPDHTHSFAVIAVFGEEILGIGRISVDHAHEGECAFVVRDADQGKHIGLGLLRQIEAWIKLHMHLPFTLHARVHVQNVAMKELLRAHGYTMDVDSSDSTMVRASKQF